MCDRVHNHRRVALEASALAEAEEEALARTILDKLAMIGSDSAGLYLFDRDLEQLEPEA